MLRCRLTMTAGLAKFRKGDGSSQGAQPIRDVNDGMRA
jgi:hypothetical protein